MPSAWRASVEYAGSLGAAGIGSVDSVVLNEVLTNEEELQVDTIELFNPIDNAVDIGGYWLSDRLNNLDKFVFPAGGYLVLDENQFGFGLNVDVDEDVVLVEPDEFGSPNSFIDHVTFGAALRGESFGRWPDEVGVLYPMVSLTFGAANSGPWIGPVVISEIMYNPSSTASFVDAQLMEFMELFDATPIQVDLTGWSVAALDFDFPSETTIGPGHSLVLVPFYPRADSKIVSAFEDAYKIDIANNVSILWDPTLAVPTTMVKHGRFAAQRMQPAVQRSHPWLSEIRLTMPIKHLGRPVPMVRVCRCNARKWIFGASIPRRGSVGVPHLVEWRLRRSSST